jgi:modulator of FtsH protease
MKFNNFNGFNGNNNVIVMQTGRPAVSVNQLLRKTYLLLSLSLFFSALAAYYGLVSGAKPGVGITLIGMFGLLFLTQFLRNSPWGLLSMFAFTGFMGYTLTPLLGFYLHSYANGGALIMTAFAGTATIFLALSAYALLTRKNFSYMGGMLFVGITVVFLLSLLGLFIQMPIFHILVAGGFMLLSSALILFHTSQIIHGGEDNAIMATISIYVALFNIFVSLLQILGFFGGSRE